MIRWCSSVGSLQGSLFVQLWVQLYVFSLLFPFGRYIEKMKQNKIFYFTK
jgi:hypothetical protein